MTIRDLLIIVSVVLFVVAGLGAIGTIAGLNVLAFVCFGLAVFALSFLPVFGKRV